MNTSEPLVVQTQGLSKSYRKVEIDHDYNNL